MIETKEQYEKIVENCIPERTGTTAVMMSWHKPLIDTIEALRDVARAAKPAVVRLQLLQAAGPIGKSPKWTQDLADAVDALPDWIKDG